MDFPPAHRTLQRSSRQTPIALPEDFAAGVFGAIERRRLLNAAWVKFLFYWSPVVIAIGMLAMMLMGLQRRLPPSSSQPPALQLYQIPGHSGKPLSLP